MLKVHEIELDNDNGEWLSLKFEGSSKKDFLLAQDIFRALVSREFNNESCFGLDDYLEPIIAFKYPENSPITLLYERIYMLRGKYSMSDSNPQKKD